MARTTMSPPPKGIIRVGETLLGDVEPRSESKRKEFNEKNIREWKERSLLEVMEVARNDREFAKKLCEKVSRLAYR
jgi:hypothetical protein